MSKKLLTIAIPTFNRAKFLLRCIDSIVTQVPKHMADRIHIHVSDNASSDGTDQHIPTIDFRGVSHSYLRQPSNLGFDRNFLSCLSAKDDSEFFMLIGDDDWFLPGALQSILTRLAQPEHIDLLYLETRESWRGRADTPVFLRTNSADFLKYINCFCSFISAFIYRFSILKINRPVYNQFLDTNLVQMSFLFQLIQGSRSIEIMTRLSVGCEPNNSGGYGFKQTFVDHFWTIWNHFETKSHGKCMLLARKTTLVSMLIGFYPAVICDYRRGKGNVFVPELVQSNTSANHSQRLRQALGIMPSKVLSLLPMVFLTLYFKTPVLALRMFRISMLPVLMAMRFYLQNSAIRVHNLLLLKKSQQYGKNLRPLD